MNVSAPRTARDRARAELTAEITATARRHLGEHGPGELSLRAVARELGMSSSALYRYFPSRDALLTQLIIEAYNDLGDACDDAIDLVDDDPLAQWRAIANGARSWARANPHDYALIYGSPVPGYAAPQDTIDPASRVVRLLVGVSTALDAQHAPAPAEVTIPRSLQAQITALVESEADPIHRASLDQQRFLAMANAWALLFGMISFEVFGRYKGMFDDADALFAHQIDRAAITLGMQP